MSQLNHLLAKRQPGSIFKPFVCAAALDTGIQGGSRVLTASTQVVDEPTTFGCDNKSWSPDNFAHDFRGTVTLRDALAHSLNVATVKVAETVGYGAVVVAESGSRRDADFPCPISVTGVSREISVVGNQCPQSRPDRPARRPNLAHARIQRPCFGIEKAKVPHSIRGCLDHLVVEVAVPGPAMFMRRGQRDRPPAAVKCLGYALQSSSF